MGAEQWRPYPLTLLAEAYGEPRQPDEEITTLAIFLAWSEKNALIYL